MHILLALIGIVGAAFVWYIRAQRAADVAGGVLEAASEVRNAARRFGFRRRAGLHVVEGVEDPKLAIAGLAIAFLELDALPTAEARAQTDLALRKHLQIDAETAREMTILGRWLMEECQGPTPAITRLSKKLRALDGGASFEPLMAILKDIVAAGGGRSSLHQSEALEDLARVFRLR